MFTRRVLFKMLAAFGASSLLPAVGEGGVERFSRLGEVLPFDRSVEGGRSLAVLGSQPVDVTATEQWENLLDDLDAVELIGRYVSLDSAPEGVSRLTGRCPFCRHGADSLLVDSRDDIYLCTDCLAGGHALDFYARMEGLSLPESLHSVGKLMAAGELQGKRPRLKRFHCIIEAIDRFAHESLICSREGASARGWLDQHGVTAGTTARFTFGVMSYALGKQLLARLLSMGISSDEVEQGGIDGWMSCLKDRVGNGEPDFALLLPVRDREGHYCGFYEQSIGEAEDVRLSAAVSPYGYQLLSPHRASRLIFSGSDGQAQVPSVVLAKRPWDVVLLAQGGMEQAVYVSPLDPGEYHDRLGKFLMCTRTVIWPIHQSELNVGFLQNLFSLSRESISRLTFLLLPEEESLPGLLRREGIGALQARLAGAISVKELVGG